MQALAFSLNQESTLIFSLFFCLFGRSRTRCGSSWADDGSFATSAQMKPLTLASKSTGSEARRLADVSTDSTPM